VQQLEGNSADGESYHGYWAQNINAVNSHFGTEADLIALSAALHSRGMYLMVDVVTNHMAYLGCGTCVDYSIFTPFNSVCSWLFRYREGNELTRHSNPTTMTSVSSITAIRLASRIVGWEITRKCTWKISSSRAKL
jgi:hypothetical protein